MNQIVKTITIRGEQVGLERLHQQMQALGVQAEEVTARTDRTSAGFTRLRASLDPAWAATRRYEGAQASLSRQLAAGKINAEEHARLTDLAKQRMLAATTAADASAGALNRQSAAARAASASVVRLNGNTANLAAQFQDIAVSAQMGMSPMMIALQQGTQISAVLGPMGARGAVAALGGAFASLVSPVSLATIAIIGLGTYGISALSEIITGTEDASKAVKENAELVDRVAKRWGDAVPALQSYVDQLERAREEAELIRAADLTSQAEYQVLQASMSGVVGQGMEIITVMRDLGASSSDVDAVKDAVFSLEEKTKLATATADDLRTVQDALSRAFATTGIAAIGDMLTELSKLEGQYYSAAKAAVALRSQAALKADESQLPTLGTVGPVFSGGGNFLNDQERIEFDARNTKSLYQIEAERNAKRGGRSKAISEAERERRAVKELIDQLEFERETVGMNAMELEIANAVRRASKGAAEGQIETIKELITQTHLAREADKKLKEEQESLARIWRGVGSEMVGGFRQIFQDGKVTVSEFTDWIANVFLDMGDRIIESALKPLENSINAFFENMGKNQGGGGWGGLLGGLFGGLFPAAPLGGGGDWLTGLYANGGAFSGGNVIPFARGGAFTNSIVDKPTLFPFAKGTGLMGEAGPEAIMPLKRASNGSLGVQVSGGAASAPVSVNYSPVITITGGDAESEARLKAMLEQHKRDMPGVAIKAVRDAQKRGGMR